MKAIFFIILGFVALSLAVSPPRKSKYVRPCKMLDFKCVRDNLAANSKCNKRVLGSVPNQYTLATFPFETPFFNASYIDNNLVIQNHNKCTVSEFFFNVEADTAVLALDCKDLIFSSNRTLIQHTSLQEDKIYSYTSTWKYPLIRLTTNLKRADSINLCSAFVFTDVAVMPKFVLTPNDKSTKDFLSYDLSFLNIYERETFFYRGPYLFKTFVNSVICDFHC